MRAIDDPVQLARAHHPWDQASTAIHEAGHAVMAYLLNRPFVTISVLPDGDSLGRVQHAPPRGDWFRPDIEVNGRIQRRIEDHVMISLAGAETERHWFARADDRPGDWEDLVRDGAHHDMQASVHLASYVCGGSPEETSAYIEWLRQRVLNFVGRIDAEVDEREHPDIARTIRFGNDRFWCLTHALAAEVQQAGTLRWRQARDVLRAADRQLLDEQLHAHRHVFFGRAEEGVGATRVSVTP
jgi:hypothetical protein